ncbi:MAG: phospholipase A [Muribaculaceae bacterium]|nr:phospholipase A [Muribaculaceae bacterium]
MLLVCCMVCCMADAQIVTIKDEKINSDSIREAFDSQPYFGLYKDNYFIFGPSLSHPDAQNTNIKFQISVAQKLTRSTLPFGTYLYLFYSQKCFWNVLERSFPMTDLNFNPGIGIAKPIFQHNRYMGKVALIAEHESNGKDGDASRSWNKISLAANILISPNAMVHGKFWIPLVDGENNRDITRYMGIYQIGTQFMSADRKFNGSVTMVKRSGWNLNFNTIVEVGMRMWKNANEYLFLQYYNGYGEGMLDYNKFHSQIRIGLQIKPSLFSDY